MQLQLDERNQELKEHGSFAFPVRVSLEDLNQYEQGAFAWHWHPEIELTCILSGEMIYQINQTEYHVHAGEALFCNTNALHTGHMIDGQNCEYVSITFHPRLLYGYEGSEMEQHFVKPVLTDGSFGSMFFTVEKDWKRQVIQNMKKIYEWSLEETDIFPMEVQIALMEIWRKIYQHSVNLRSNPDNSSAKNVDRLRSILQYIHEHYAEQLTLEEIAESVHICKSECCRFFKKQMNQTIFEYLLEYRISQSLSLLKNGSSVTEAGGLCGFPNPAYYSRIFKKQMGYAPREYLNHK